MSRRKPSPDTNGTEPSQVIDRYQSSDVAESYSRRWGSTLGSKMSNGLEQMLVRRALKSIGQVEDILDCPCGAGRMWGLLSAHSERLSVCDASRAMLDVALERNPGITLARADVAPVQALPHEDSSVDLAFCCRLMHHFSSSKDRVDVLRSLGRISRRYVVFTTRIAASPKPLRRFWRRVTRRRPSGRVSSRFSTTLAEIEQEVSLAGLKQLRRFHKTPVGSPLVLIICEKLPA